MAFVDTEQGVCLRRAGYRGAVNVGRVRRGSLVPGGSIASGGGGGGLSALQQALAISYFSGNIPAQQQQ